MLSRRVSVLTIVGISQLVGLVFVAVFVGVRHVAAPPPSAAAWATLAGIAGVVGIGGLYRGMSLGAMSVVAPLTATAAVIPTIVGLATGDHLDAAQGAGIVLALLGV